MGAALRRPSVSPGELRTLESEFTEAGRLDAAAACRAELARRANESSRCPLYLRVLQAAASDYGRKRK